MLKAKKTITGKKCVGEVLDYRNTITIEEGTLIKDYFIRNEHTVMTEIDGVEYDIGHVSYYEEVNSMKNIIKAEIIREMNAFKDYVNASPGGKETGGQFEFGTQFCVDACNILINLEKGKLNVAYIFVNQVLITTVIHEDIDIVIETASDIVEMEVM